MIASFLYVSWWWLGENSNQIIALASLLASISLAKGFFWDKLTRINVKGSFKDDNCQALPHATISNNSTFDVKIREAYVECAGRRFYFPNAKYTKESIPSEEKLSLILHDRKLLPVLFDNRDEKLYVKMETSKGIPKSSKPFYRNMSPEEWEELGKFLEVNKDLRN